LVMASFCEPQAKLDALVIAFSVGSKLMSVNVVIALNNMLFSSGVKNLLNSDKNIRVVEILKSGSKYSLEKLEKINPDVIIVDFTSLYNAFPADYPETHKGFILVDTDCGRENIVSAVLTKRVSGVLLGDTTPKLLIKAIKAVAKGDVWIDKSTVKNLLFGINALKHNTTARLTGKEKEIVNLISQGFTNKEIAKKLHVGESTVKTHLHHVFQKLDIKNRAQLVTYAVKNHDIGHGVS